MLIVVAGDTMPTSTSTVKTNTVEIYDLTSPGSAWLPTTNFPFLISGSRGVTLDNIFYVTGGWCDCVSSRTCMLSIVSILGGQAGICNWNPDSASWASVAQLCSRDRKFHGASIVPLTEDLLQHCKSCLTLQQDQEISNSW